MRLRALASAAVLLAVLALAGRWTRPAAAPPERRPPVVPSTLAGPPVADHADDHGSGPTRDPFRYADDPRPRAAPAVGPSPSTLTPFPTRSPEPALRLVGLVRRPDGLRAAVAIAGEVVVLKRGESAGGWTLVALDEEGARLRGPDGREESLALSE